MSRIFLIAGLGADARVYNDIDLSGHEVTAVDWIKPARTDTLPSYAQKLISKYNITNGSVVIGYSLGGIISIEVAKLVAPQKVIILSGIKTIDEEPAYFNLFRKLPFYRIFPPKLLPLLGFLIEPVFGKMSAQDRWLFKDMLKRSSASFMKWALGAGLRWDNKVVPKNTYHIAGDKDLVFPSRLIKNAIIVKGGSHLMIFDKAAEINTLLKDILKTNETS